MDSKELQQKFIEQIMEGDYPIAIYDDPMVLRGSLLCDTVTKKSIFGGDFIDHVIEEDWKETLRNAERRPQT